MLVAGRDEEFHRWLGPGAAEPAPVAVVVVDGEIVGWVDDDGDADHDWLRPGEVNVGYYVFAAHRRRGYASAAVELLRRQLVDEGVVEVAMLLIDPGNEASLGVALRAGFTPRGEVGGQRLFERRLR